MTRFKLALVFLLAIISLVVLNYLFQLTTVHDNHQFDIAKYLPKNLNFKNNTVANIFSYDVVVNKKLTNKEGCKVIHIGVVSAGTTANLYFHILLKSIYFYRSNPLHFHVLVNDVSQKTVYTLFDTWAVPQVNISLYGINEFIPDVSWVQTHHYSGIYGLLKLVFPKVLPYHITKIIILDTDIIFNGDIGELWLLFGKFNINQLIGLVENESDFYLSKTSMRWPAVGRGYNTGIMLYNLERMRNIGWNDMWCKIANESTQLYGAASLADQDIINAIIKQHPEILFEVPCYWNIQLSDHTLSFNCYETNPLKAIHWNSPRKINVINRDGHYFRSIYTRFTELNGNLLRTVLNDCSNSLLRHEDIVLDTCDEFYQITSRKWRTLLFFRKFEYVPVSNDVTFVAQFSFDRLQLLEQLCTYWKGPMSLTLYATDPEFQEAIVFLNNLGILKTRMNIGFHVVFKSGEYYPINLLRNVGLEHVNTPFVFLADVDFLPMPNLYYTLRQYIAKTKNMDRKAFIVPAFESQKYKSNVPRNKAELLKMVRNKKIFTFRYDVWASGHAPTDYTKWYNSETPYKVKWEPDFEPYVVVKSDVSKYDIRFMGFGWNKVSHIMELNAQGYDFIVLPDVFIVHKPHSPSNDILKFRKSPTYRMCLQKLKEDFVTMLQTKYNMKFRNNSRIINEFE